MLLFSMVSLVEKLIKRGCVTINQSASINELILKLNKYNFGCLVVLNESKKVCGIVSERDIIRNYNLFNNNSKVFDIMTKDTITCSLKITSEKLMQIMTENKIRHIPIVEDENLLGIVSIGDVVNRLIKNFNDEAKNLRDYINS